MGILAIGGVLLGIVLGRIFRSLVLLPVSLLAVVNVLGCLIQADDSLGALVLKISAAVASIQFGYVIGLAASALAPDRDRSKDPGAGGWRLIWPLLKSKEQSRSGSD
jgi:hypothetical protein